MSRTSIEGERFPHLVGWWVELTPDEPVTRRRFLRSPVTTQVWEWRLKRPDPNMPFGFSISGWGQARSEEQAVNDAMAAAEKWERRKVRQEQTRRVDL